MSDELPRLIESEDGLSKRLLSSSDVDVPSDHARNAARVAIGLGVAAAPIGAAAASTMALGTKLGLVTALGATVALGVVLTRSPAPPPPPEPVPVEVVVPEPAPQEVEPEAPVVEPETVAPPQPKPKPRPAPRESGLDAEVRLLDGARAAHAAAKYDRALVLVKRYQARFASGMLREEADALEVRALTDAGRTADARRAAKAFVARYPESSHAAGFGTLLE